MAAAQRGGAGGIAGLRELIRRHGKAVEADIRREYGVRLRDLFSQECGACGQGRLTWRELAAYVAGLSPQAATRTALNDGRVEPTQEALILADLFDAISVEDYHFVSANADPKKAPPKPPKPYPRWWLQASGPDNSERRVAKLDDARKRKRERQEAIAQGLIS